jgi:hypothetical protein
MFLPLAPIPARLCTTTSVWGTQPPASDTRPSGTNAPRWHRRPSRAPQGTGWVPLAVILKTAAAGRQQGGRGRKRSSAGRAG